MTLNGAQTNQTKQAYGVMPCRLRTQDQAQRTGKVPVQALQTPSRQNVVGAEQATVVDLRGMWTGRREAGVPRNDPGITTKPGLAKPTPLVHRPHSVNPPHRGTWS